MVVALLPAALIASGYGGTAPLARPPLLGQARVVYNGDIGDLSAFAASWNNQHFNQGSPKPGALKPGLTAGPTGSYDPATKKYTLEWSSQIAEGPFNNFTGVWHFEGTFEPKT